MTTGIEEYPLPSQRGEPASLVELPGAETPTPPVATQPRARSVGEDDINLVATGVSADDMPIMVELARLARRGKSAQILRALELARVNPSRAEELRDRAEAHDTARRVLSAALAVRGSGLVRHGIEPTDAAKPDLFRNALYVQRHNVSLRATRPETYRISEFRYYEAGCLAILAAGAKIPSLQELRAS